MSLYLCVRWVACLPAVACDVCTFGLWCLVVFARFSVGGFDGLYVWVTCSL